MEKLHETSNTYTRYDPDIDVIVCSADESVEGEEFRQYMTDIVNGLRETGSSKVVVDVSDTTTQLPENVFQWAVTTWSQLAVDSGLEHLAVAMPESMFATLGIEKMLESGEVKVNQKTFPSRDRAVEWIQRQESFYTSTRVE
jgi:hypothetical protein